MIRRVLSALTVFFILLLQWPITSVFAAQPPAPPLFTWTTVVNNEDVIPGTVTETNPTGRKFNSYNQPSVNASGRVVFRARSRGGPPLGPATHGIYLRDMGSEGEVSRVLDRTTEVPYPNTLGTLFVETPAFPRIDQDTDTIVTRGNHQPVWEYLLPDGSETRAGTTGIYACLDGELVTGMAKLGAVPEFPYFAVPGFDQPISFDVFPGAPSVTGTTLVFKGNYTWEGAQTGVYYLDLDDDIANSRLIADTFTFIPGRGESVTFGSTALPSAADGLAVFAGFDDEWAPRKGGIYLVPLRPDPPLELLVGIGDRVPGGSKGDVFTHLGEGLGFDGRLVAFWGAWGAETRTVRLYCPEEGNKNRIDFCNSADSGSSFDETGGKWYQEREVPVSQGIFLHDSKTDQTSLIARAGEGGFEDFVFWGYSGRVPGARHAGGEEDDGEPVRWRSSSFAAVTSVGARISYVAFKALKENGITGIYLGQPGSDPVTVIDTTMDGQALDPEAPLGSLITEVGLEREGLREGWLAVSARMGIEGGSEEEGMAGIYLTRMPLPGR